MDGAIMGLEAALMHLGDAAGRMNSTDGAKDSATSITATSALSQTTWVFGFPIGLSKAGHMVKYNRSVLAAMGGEDPWMSLIPGAVMGNHDELLGPVEAITAGKSLTIGGKYREKSQEDSA